MPNTSTESYGEQMLKWFNSSHLPPELKIISSYFGVLAVAICERIEPGPERATALRKLLEAKDAAVRATVHPGG